MSRFSRAITCYDCKESVSGSIAYHRTVCSVRSMSNNNNNAKKYDHPITFHDCGESVSGSIKQHHLVCAS